MEADPSYLMLLEAEPSLRLEPAAWLKPVSHAPLSRAARLLPPRRTASLAETQGRTQIWQRPYLRHSPSHLRSQRKTCGLSLPLAMRSPSARSAHNHARACSCCAAAVAVAYNNTLPLDCSSVATACCCRCSVHTQALPLLPLLPLLLLPLLLLLLLPPPLLLLTHRPCRVLVLPVAHLYTPQHTYTPYNTA